MVHVDELAWLAIESIGDFLARVLVPSKRLQHRGLGDHPQRFARFDAHLAFLVLDLQLQQHAPESICPRLVVGCESVSFGGTQVTAPISLFS